MEKDFLYVGSFVLLILIVHAIAGNKPTINLLLLVIAGIILTNQKTITTFSNQITGSK